MISSGDNPSEKYRPKSYFELVNRQWPSKTLQTAPAWCSVDLRDGNQALIEPMSIGRKKAMFDLLSIGFKEIEIGFPSGCQIDFDFCRQLIENKLIPEDVTVQVLVQAREHLIQDYRLLGAAARRTTNERQCLKSHGLPAAQFFGSVESAVTGIFYGFSP